MKPETEFVKSHRLALRLLGGIAFCVATVISYAEVAGQGEEKDSQEASRLDFFESRIRPVLVEHCYRCHDAKAVAKGQLKGGLRIDSRQGLIAGGDSGAAVVPNQPDESMLLAAIRYESFEMPPSGQLPASIVADFEKWINDGAVDPRDGDSTSTKPVLLNLEEARRHWAYRPLAEGDPSLASVEPKNIGGSTIDSLLASALRDAGLTPNPAADRDTLVRRIYLDLWGIPPTRGELERFREDRSPLAYERLVDRILASPEFGQHWGRHWLDIVRFGESVTLRGLVQHQAWRYRDYVIESLNHDLPYDQFLREQIAGDLMETDSIAQAQGRHVATTFLALTNANLEDQDKEKLRMDVVDEQLNVIGKAFLGQTLGCARCHDHKFDPIPNRDYYAMAGILRNTRTLAESNVSNWLDLELPLSLEERQKWVDHDVRVGQLEGQIKRLKPKTAATKAAAVALDSLPGIVIDDQMATLKGVWLPSTSIAYYVTAGYQHDANMDQGEKSATYSADLIQPGKYEVRISYGASGNRSSRTEVTVLTKTGPETVVVNQRLKPAIDNLFHSLGEFEFTADQPAQVVISNQNADGVVIIDAVQFLQVGVPATAKTPPTKPPTDLEKAETQRIALEVKRLEADLAKVRAEMPPRPKYMGGVAWEEIGDMPIHVRGNAHQLGEIVPRGFLQVATYSPPPQIPAGQGGRLQFAEWLTDQHNPLPPRVITNRVWLWLFGNGLVSTPDNFGHAGKTPTHPELLDYLSLSLLRKQWSLKALIREIVLSDAYRRSSQTSAAGMAKDPANQLLWRMNRRRLEAESIQDSILATAGRLNRTHGGSTIPAKLTADYGFRYSSERRAIYWPHLRNSIPELIGVFDGADPSLVVGKRNVSNVSTQALFMMNNDWVIQQSEATARDLLGTADAMHESLSDTLDELFLRCLGRKPLSDERAATLKFLNSSKIVSDSDRLSRWTLVVQSLFSTIEFRYRF
jgi:hypothetical protein